MSNFKKVRGSSAEAEHGTQHPAHEMHASEWVRWVGFRLVHDDADKACRGGYWRIPHPTDPVIQCADAPFCGFEDTGFRLTRGVPVSEYRVARGAGSDDMPFEVRESDSVIIRQLHVYSFIGFRLVRDL